MTRNRRQRLERYREQRLDVQPPLCPLIRHLQAWAPDVAITLVLLAVFAGPFIAGILLSATYDIGVYHAYGEAIVSGAVPYRDLGIEYPPGSLALFVLPALVTDSLQSFELVFASAMMVAAALVLAGVRRLESRLNGSSAMITVPLVLVFGLIAVVGTLAVARFDLVPAALTVGALLALIDDRRRLAAVSLGAAIAVKLYPVVLLPVVVTYVARREGRRAATGMAALALSVVAITYAPFVIWSPTGVLESFRAQLFRSLQVESLPGSLFAAAHRIFGIRLPTQDSYYDFPSHSADVAATFSVGVGIAVLIALWITQARSPATSHSLVRFSAASVVTFVAFGKVLSPQYMLWLIPLVPLVGGRRGRLAAGLLALACFLTAVGFPHYFNALIYDLAAKPLAAIVIRDVLLVAVVTVLGWPRSIADADPSEPDRKRHVQRVSCSRTIDWGPARASADRASGEKWVG